MTHLNYISFLFLVFSFNLINPNPNPNRIIINIPTAEEETQYIWSNLQNTKFFEENNYTVSYPKGELIEVLKEKAIKGELNDEDFESLNQFIKESIYNKTDYQNGYQKIEDQRALINRMINKLGKCKRNWNFKYIEQYEVNLTLYGPGGSYDPDIGSIVILTTKEGGFKQHPNPANTLIHEVIHIGIEESIVNKYSVPHSLKERIVDKFVLLNFDELLPEYRIQNMGDVRIDKYLKKKKDLRKLDSIVEKFLKEN